MIELSELHVVLDPSNRTSMESKLTTGGEAKRVAVNF